MSRSEPVAAVPDDSRDGDRRFLRPRNVVLALVALLLAVVVWSVAIEPRFILSEQEEVAQIPNLPAGWEGATVGVLADLQIGMWWDNVGMAERAVEALVDRRPDVVLVLGDFVYDKADTVEEVDTALDVLRPLTDAGIVTFAVLGNHDHHSGAAELLQERLPEIGIELLHNESTTIERGGDALHVAGVGAARPGLARPDAAVDGIPDDEARIVMMHNPASFDGLPEGSAPLAVAGHTHGGQIRVPFMPEWSYLSLVEDHPVRTDGWIEGYGAPGNQLFVNRGIGMSLIPARLNCSPAITVFELRPERAS